MVNLTKNRLDEIQSGFAGKRIAVVGDLMLDRYFWGKVSRISPEAPVPVVEVEEESTRLGGAANVANNIASLGGTPIMIGIVGNDTGGESLRKLVTEKGFPILGIVTDETRPTTIKTRVIAHNQHVVRIDREEKMDLDADVQARVVANFENQINSLDGIILEDYNKGVLTKGTIASIIRISKEHRKTITVDPKYNNFFEYKDVSVFKPNRKETEEALGRRLECLPDVEKAARELMSRLQADNVLLTMGEKGMILLERNGTLAYVETKARHVADVSGAGDTVIATLTMGMVAGASVGESAALANYAGGIVCGEVGIVPIDKGILIQTILKDISNGGKR
ncbi:MAG: D-glycero-beta-D-manno-heptose-7-phosphate kinase [Ignavibacteriae bacterium]|nr:MAG: D-glycero-beta-D-manno-heptose-7-phosphate kinase [Ignavibacteriota bacterium]